MFCLALNVVSISRMEAISLRHVVSLMGGGKDQGIPTGGTGAAGRGGSRVKRRGERESLTREDGGRTGERVWEERRRGKQQREGKDSVG